MEDLLSEGSGRARATAARLVLPGLGLPLQMPRSNEVTRVLRSAPAGIGIQYAHRKAPTIMPTHLPPGATCANYSGSGWPCFEQSVAGLLSGESYLLDITPAARSSLLSGAAPHAFKLRCSSARCEDVTRK